jgi:hypothetical protein
MTPNKRDLKAYVRYDGSGRVVPSSLILRKNKPKVGKWAEIPAYECCNFVVLYYTPASYPIVDPNVRIFCSGVDITDQSAIGYTANDINELVEILNNEQGTSNFGNYTAQPDGTVKLTVPQSVAYGFCPTGTLTFEITPD